MNTLVYINRVVLPAAYQLLPVKMNSLEANVELIAIGLQESRFKYRHQQSGPAGGFWEFEEIGVKGVINHWATRSIILPILDTMTYAATVPSIQDALDNNDILACIYARLMLWTSPKPLPALEEPRAAWDYYISCWRPGKPHLETWDGFHRQARSIVLS